MDWVHLKRWGATGHTRHQPKMMPHGSGEGKPPVFNIQLAFVPLICPDENRQGCFTSEPHVGTSYHRTHNALK